MPEEVTQEELKQFIDMAARLVQQQPAQTAALRSMFMYRDGTNLPLTVWIGINQMSEVVWDAAEFVGSMGRQTAHETHVISTEDPSGL